jgi:hypothetical protein
MLPTALHVAFTLATTLEPAELGGGATSAPTPPAPPPTASAAAPAKAQPPDASPTLLGPVRLGPVIGVGAPEALQVGALVTYKNVVGLAFAYGTLPKVAVPGLGGATITRSSLELDLRGYPWRGPFFVGLGVGRAKTRGSVDAGVRAYRTNIPATATARMEATYLSPKIGVMWITKPGIAFGADAGVQIPISPEDPEFTQSSLGLTVPVQPDNQLATIARKVARQPLPFVNLIRVAYMF